MKCPKCGGDRFWIYPDGSGICEDCQHKVEHPCPKCGSEMEKEDYMGEPCWWCDTCRAYYPRHEEKVKDGGA